MQMPASNKTSSGLSRFNEITGTGKSCAFIKTAGEENRVIKKAQWQNKVYKAKRAPIEEVKDKGILGAIWSTIDETNADHPPEQVFIDHYNQKCIYGDNLVSSVRSEKPARDQFDLNYLSIDDLVDHWRLLDKHARANITRLVRSDLKGNRNRYGFKDLAMESGLLLGEMLDYSNMVSNGNCWMTTNLKSPNGDYSRFCISSRALCPKTSLRAGEEFLRKHNIEALVNSGYVGYTFVIEPSSKELRNPWMYASNEEYRGAVQAFYRKNNALISRMLWKLGLFDASLQAHETSVLSLGAATGRPELLPHTHAVLFMQRGGRGASKRLNHEQYLERVKSYLEKHGLKASFLMEEVEDEFGEQTSTYRQIRGKNNIEGYIRYLHRCYNLANVYAREIRPGLVRETNLAAKEVARLLLELRRGESGNRKKGVRFVTSNCIPRAGETKVKKPVLQKSKKKSKLKRAYQSRKKTTMEKLELDPGVKAGFIKQSTDLGLSEPFAEGMLREAEELLTEKVAAELDEEKAFLADLRETLIKAAEQSGSTVYTKEDIYEITSSRASFEKAAMDEAHQVWDGIREQLVKEGADEAFIEGMVKEAGGLGVLKGIFNYARQGRGFTGTMKNLGEGLGAAGHALKGKFTGATQTAAEAMLQGDKSLPILRNRAGKIIRDDASLGKYKDTGEYAFWDRLKSKQPTNIPTSGQAAGTPGSVQGSLVDAGLDKTRSTMVGQTQRSTHNELDKRFLGIQEELASPDKAVVQAAKDKIEKIRLGDYSPILGDTTNKTQRSVNNVHRAKATNVNQAIDKDRLQGLRDSATDIAGAGYDVRSAGSHAGKMTREALTNKPINTGHIRFTPGKGLKRGAGGALLGSYFGLPGAAIGGGLGLATGTLGTGGAALAGAGALGVGGYLGAKAVGNMVGGGNPNELDITGAPVDRNRAIPALSNRFAGTVGGALLAAIIANWMGLEGPASWLVPVLGGVAGYNYFPDMMNRWKDPYGYGANMINPMDAAYNQQYR